MVKPVQALTYPEQAYIHGDVDIAPGVAIAGGVILGAEPGCRLVISSAVCLGVDVVVQASRGDLIIEPGVNLGSGVLVVGHGRICDHACIGAASTLINPAIQAHQVVPPKSLLGAIGQACPFLSTSDGSSNTGHGADTEQTHSTRVNSPNGKQKTGIPEEQQAENNGLSQAENAADESVAKVSQVYGKAQINQLLNTLFPHRHALNGASNGDKA